MVFLLHLITTTNKLNGDWINSHRKMPTDALWDTLKVFFRCLSVNSSVQYSILNITYVALYLYPAPMYLFAFGAVVVFIYSADFNSCHFVPEQWINKYAFGLTIISFPCMFRLIVKIVAGFKTWLAQCKQNIHIANAINLQARTFACMFIWIDSCTM